MLLPLLMVVVVLAWWACWRLRRRRMMALARLLPGPPALPLLGNALKLDVPIEELTNVFYELMKEYGDVVRLWLGPDLNVVVSDPEDVKVEEDCFTCKSGRLRLKCTANLILQTRTDYENIEMQNENREETIELLPATSTENLGDNIAKRKNLLSNPNTSTKGPQYKYMVEILGEGILSGSGPTWRTRRKIVLPNYGKKAVESYEDLFNREGNQLLLKLKARVGGGSFDIFDDVATCTTYIVCQSIMGLTMQETLNLPNLNDIMHESNNMYLLIFLRMTKWHLQIEPLFRLTKHYQLLVSFKKKINETMEAIMRHRLRVLEAMDDDRKRKILNLKGDNKHNTELSVVDRLVLSNQISSYGEMLGEILTLFTSSQEATAKITSFLLLMMAYHPEYQEKVAAEIKSVFGDSDRNVTEEDLKHMPFLDMAFKEVVRLFPIGVMLQRTLSEDIKIKTCNATLPAGCSLVVPIFHMHRDERYWTNPNQFRPERFSPENAKQLNLGCFIPFSLGPMDCLGRHFGTKVVKTMAVKVLREFRLTSPESYEDMRLMMAISTASVNGYPVQLHPRKH